jgi:pimeloyl-ACP methyl ester carboxylesterase
VPKVTIDGHDLFYVHRPAEGSEHSLLFIHGAGGTHKHWGYQVQGLGWANRYALDLPGHGRSEGAGKVSIEGYAAVVLEVTDALGLGQVTLVGHSMGGAIAQYLALSLPSRVDGLVLVGSGARLRVLPSLLEGLLQDFPAAVESMLSWAYSDRAPQSLVRLGQEEWLDNDPRVVHDDFAACDAFDVMDKLCGISCPTLVLCGEDDRLTPPKYARYLADKIPNATLGLVPGAGHMAMLEQPELVNQAIEQFLGPAVG